MSQGFHVFCLLKTAAKCTQTYHSGNTKWQCAIGVEGSGVWWRGLGTSPEKNHAKGDQRSSSHRVTMTFDPLTPKLIVSSPYHPNGTPVYRRGTPVPICSKFRSFLFKNILFTTFITHERTDGKVETRTLYLTV